MININFVPDDYVQGCQSRRANFMYLVLFLAVMTGLGVAFLFIRARQRTLSAQEAIVDQKMLKAAEFIKQFDQIRQKQKAMTETIVVLSELKELVPRSILLAAIINNLPPGVSLRRLQLAQKKLAKNSARRTYSGKYKLAGSGGAGLTRPSGREMSETHIEIEGIAPSDIEVAGFIAQLNRSVLLDSVALVLSKECRINDQEFRHFKLTAVLKKEVHLTQDDIVSIKTKRQSFM